MWSGERFVMAEHVHFIPERASISSCLRSNDPLPEHVEHLHKVAILHRIAFDKHIGYAILQALVGAVAEADPVNQGKYASTWGGKGLELLLEPFESAALCCTLYMVTITTYTWSKFTIVAESNSKI
jgi:hypothetical protein